ncbi:hypothetical protein [Streptomyces acidiscabies]|uniref:hypothetical protein n=1 Tax=Streptomyces acidiscabies TaxID=42234 RepID=UPI00076EDCC6|nr:hypothetical protein [Streptomyces acidiscabies]GAQ55167.1 hypothetical protein a10_04989 [Streptomyces acidiscabies]
MNDPGPPPSPKNPGDGFPAAPAAYHGVGLVPPSGPARTWGLAVVGVPLVLVLLLTLAGSLSGGSDDNSSRSSGFWGGSSGLPGTSESSSPADTSAGSWGWSGASESETATAPSYSYEESVTPSDSASAYVESATPTPTPSPSPSGPEAVVTAYFDAINNGDYSTAWSLGGRNLDADYDAFVAGFATTQSDTITVTSVQGADVHLTLVARQTDGTTKTYDKVYTVSGGEIVKSSGNQIS